MKEEYLHYPANYFTATIHEWKPLLASGNCPDVLCLFIMQFGGFALGLQVWSLGSKFRVRIWLQETTHRTAEGTHWNALFRWSWNTRTKPGGLTRCSLDPGADARKLWPVKVDNEPLYHNAVALGTPNRFRIRAQTFRKGIVRSCHSLIILFYCQYWQH